MVKSWPLLLAIASLVTPALAADRSELTPAERQALISQIGRCVPPLNIATRSVTTIDLRLNADGSVTDESKVVSSPTPEVGKAMLRAVSQCQPYRLPAQKYQNWKQILVDFDLVRQGRTSFQATTRRTGRAWPMRQGEGNMEGKLRSACRSSRWAGLAEAAYRRYRI